MIADKHYGAAIDGYTRHATPPVQAVPTLACCIRQGCLSSRSYVCLSVSNHNMTGVLSERRDMTVTEHQRWQQQLIVQHTQSEGMH